MSGAEWSAPLPTLNIRKNFIMAMNAKELVRSMDLNFAVGKTMLVKGASGIGKSEISYQYALAQRAKRGRYGYFMLNAATANLANVIGFMIPVKKEWQGVPFTQGDFTYPESFRDVDTGEPAMAFDEGMFVIEEWGQAQGDVKRALATLVHSHHIGEHKLKKGINILVLSNRPEDRSGVTKEFDFIINRWNEQTLEAQVEPLVEHYLDIGVSEVTLAFLVDNTQTVLHSKAPEKQGPWCTPRSLAALDKFIVNALSNGVTVDDPIITQNAEGYVGLGATAQYMAYLRLRSTLPQFKDILAKPMDTFVPTAPDALMLTVYTLAAHVKRDTLGKIIQYIDRMPQAFATTFTKAMLKKNPTFISTKEMGDWSRRNVALLAAIQQV